MFFRSAVLATTAVIASVAAQNLVVNPGFDLDGNAAAPSSWTLSDPVNDFTDSTYFQSSAYSLLIGSTTSATIAQSIAGVVPALCYSVSFYAGIEQDLVLAASDLSVSFGTLSQAVDLTVLTPLLTAGNAGFGLYTYYAIATLDPTLTFTASSEFYLHLDTVDVQLTDPLNCLAPSGRTRARRAKRHGHAAQW